MLPSLELKYQVQNVISKCKILKKKCSIKSNKKTEKKKKKKERRRKKKKFHFQLASN